MVILKILSFLLHLLVAHPTVKRIFFIWFMDPFISAWTPGFLFYSMGYNMFLSWFIFMWIIPGLAFQLASISNCHDLSLFEHLFYSLAQDVPGSPFLSSAPLRNQDADTRCAHRLRVPLFPGSLCRWVRDCVGELCAGMCANTHVYISLEINRCAMQVCM